MDVLALVLLAAQAGDRAGEEQPPLPADLEIPPAPALSWEEELATFRVADGYTVELVAAEPLVHDPVAIAWDERQRLWVCEMRGYMPNVDGEGEREPVGSIAVLTDTDGDGRMDERQVFLDELVLPRAIRPMRGGLLYIEPPDLIFCRDEDGDGRGDAKEIVDTGLGGIESPEHAVNGLLIGIDNWIHCANHPWSYRYRPRDEKWERRRVAQAGQWGIAKDDLGRIFFNTNPDPLRGDPYSSHYAVRNPNHGRAAGVNVRYAHDKRVWPSRITPGVNRGYQPQTLRDDFTLASFTGACGPAIHFGEAFVCEPCGNLVKRYALEEKEDGSYAATNVVEGTDFLTSTDERFRPVNLAGGPDGALYVVDMYRGVIQHRIFVTSFLRKQILERELEQPIGLGRIWRVVNEDAELPDGPDLAKASWTQLVACLSHPNVWWRDTAQRLLIEEGRDDSDAIELVRELAADDTASPLGRMHALWALEGMNRLNARLVSRALRAEDQQLVAAAARCADSSLNTRGELSEAMLKVLRRTGSPFLRRQILLSLDGSSLFVAQHMAMLFDPESRAEREAVLSGVGGHELDLVRHVVQLGAWSGEEPGRREFLKLLARAVGREGISDNLDQLLLVAARRPVQQVWQRDAIIEGLLAARPKGPDGKPSFLHLREEPVVFDKLAALGPKAEELAASLAWPGRDDVELPVVRPLTGDERARFERGRELYAITCAQCHQASGLGEEGKGPPLRSSPYVLGPEERLTRIVRWGLTGPVVVDGRTWDLEMPAWSSGDEDLAALLTYIRREWGHGAEPVTKATVAAVAEAVGKRSQPFTIQELEEPPEGSDR